MVSAIRLVDMAGVETLNEARGKLARKAGQLNLRNGRGRGLPAIVLMTDDTRDADWVEAAKALPAGSAVVVRHRDARAREQLARRLRAVCAPRRIKLLIAEDAALAQRVRADGVHLPQRAMSKVGATRALNRRWLVTTSAHGSASVAMASRLGADALLVAPVFETASHAERRALGALGLSALIHQAGLAAYALGGVDAFRVQRLMALPISGIALIGGWTKP